MSAEMAPTIGLDFPDTGLVRKLFEQLLCRHVFVQSADMKFSRLLVNLQSPNKKGSCAFGGIVPDWNFEKQMGIHLYTAVNANPFDPPLI